MNNDTEKLISDFLHKNRNDNKDGYDHLESFGSVNKNKGMLKLLTNKFAIVDSLNIGFRSVSYKTSRFGDVHLLNIINLDTFDIYVLEVKDDRNSIKIDKFLNVKFTTYQAHDMRKEYCFQSMGSQYSRGQRGNSTILMILNSLDMVEYIKDNDLKLQINNYSKIKDYVIGDEIKTFLKTVDNYFHDFKILLEQINLTVELQGESKNGTILHVENNRKMKI